MKMTFKSGITFGAGLDYPEMRRMAQAEPEAYAQRMLAVIESGKLALTDINLTEMFHALNGVPVKTTMSVLGREHAITTGMFPLLVSGMTIAGLTQAVEAIPTVSDQLVTEVEDPHKISVFANVTNEDVQVDSVGEGQDYPEIGAGEEKYEIRTLKNGRRLSITDETLRENNVADFVRRLNALAEIAVETVERQTLRRVCDIDGSATSPGEPYVLRRNGAGASLYSASANTPGTRAPSGTRVVNNALADETDLNAARARLATMKNSLGNRIDIPMSRCILLVPDALAGTAWKTLNSEYVPGVENEISVWGPRGNYRPTLLSTPRLDDLSATAWYLGDFKSQFVRKWALRYEYVSMGADTESFLRTSIAFQARIAWSCEVGATDYNRVVQCLTASTAP